MLLMARRRVILVLPLLLVFTYIECFPAEVSYFIRVLVAGGGRGIASIGVVVLVVFILVLYFEVLRFGIIEVIAGCCKLLILQLSSIISLIV
jgi:hypothetical protein